MLMQNTYFDCKYSNAAQEHQSYGEEYLQLITKSLLQS